MRKNIFSFILSVNLIFVGQGLAFAQSGGGAAGAAGAAASMMQGFVGAAASGAFSAQNFAQCQPPKGIPNCIMGVMGILQLVSMLGMSQSAKGSASDLINGAFDGFDPSAAGFCLDGVGCEQDILDQQLTGLSEALKTGVGFDEAIDQIKKDALSKLDDLEKKGFKIDRVNGTVTDPSGKLTKLGDLTPKIPSSISKAASEKLAGIEKTLGKLKTNRGVASSGGGGGIIYQDEYIDGPGRSLYSSKSTLDEDKKTFLAALSDKDAARDGVGFMGDDIFGMIQRRYKKKTKALEFEL